MAWSPEQYLAFEEQRTRPARDLIAALPTRSPSTTVDLGCGPGNSTALLAAHLRTPDILGIDNAPEMIAAARSRHPELTFELASIEAWRPEKPVSLIFSNAALHWLPRHDTLLPRLASCLNPQGCLAIQMPDNLQEPAHRLMRTLAQQPPWAETLSHAGDLRTEILTPDEYYRLLKPTCSNVDIFRTTYHHVLPGGPDAIVDWFGGSGLRPYLEPLNEDGKAAFLDRYRQSIAAAYPQQRDGSVLLPFPRLFIVARR